MHIRHHTTFVYSDALCVLLIASNFFANGRFPVKTRIRRNYSYRSAVKFIRNLVIGPVDVVDFCQMYTCTLLSPLEFVYVELNMQFHIQKAWASAMSLRTSAIKILAHYCPLCNKVAFRYQNTNFYFLIIFYLNDHIT